MHLKHQYNKNTKYSKNTLKNHLIFCEPFSIFSIFHPHSMHTTLFKDEPLFNALFLTTIKHIHHKQHTNSNNTNTNTNNIHDNNISGTVPFKAGFSLGWRLVDSFCVKNAIRNKISPDKYTEVVHKFIHQNITKDHFSTHSCTDMHKSTIIFNSDLSIFSSEITAVFISGLLQRVMDMISKEKMKVRPTSNTEITIEPE